MTLSTAMKHVSGVFPETDAPPRDPVVPASSGEQEALAWHQEERKVSKRLNQREESPGGPCSKQTVFTATGSP